MPKVIPTLNTWVYSIQRASENETNIDRPKQWSRPTNKPSNPKVPLFFRERHKYLVLCGLRRIWRWTQAFNSASITLLKDMATHWTGTSFRSFFFFSLIPRHPLPTTTTRVGGCQLWLGLHPNPKPAVFANHLFPYLLFHLLRIIKKYISRLVIITQWSRFAIVNREDPEIRNHENLLNRIKTIWKLFLSSVDVVAIQTNRELFCWWV